jgi:hypothetical protein
MRSSWNVCPDKDEGQPDGLVQQQVNQTANYSYSSKSRMGKVAWSQSLFKFHELQPYFGLDLSLSPTHQGALLSFQ